MSLFLIFLIVLTGVCFSTIFLMEQPEEATSAVTKAEIRENKNIDSPRT